MIAGLVLLPVNGQDDLVAGLVLDSVPVSTPNPEPAGHPSGLRSLLLVIITGIGAGFLSGLFGVGGGLVIVPALMSALKMEQRRAAATSLVAIVLTAAAGCVSYAVRGQVSLPAAAFLVVGALVGTQIGVYLLRRLPDWILPWIFIAFVVIVVISQQVKVPVRDAQLILDLPRAIALVAVGVLSGVFAGLVGVGGGSVIVPGLELIVGVGDLLARGTSLLVMIPTAVTGTWTNLKHKIADLKTGLIVGGCAAAMTPLGTMTAAAVTPWMGNLLFSAFLVAVTINMLLKARAKRS